MDGTRVKHHKERGRSTTHRPLNQQRMSGDRSNQTGVQLPPLNMRNVNMNEQFNNTNIGQISSSTKYSKYSSRVKRGRGNNKNSIFQNRMKKVIVSVDRRK